MSTKTDQRAKSILQVLLRHGNTSVDELAEQLGPLRRPAFAAT
jgi:DeoR/GlpR family transcriptional regulator of sugar metabolism